MKRNVMAALAKWQDDPQRKPLILRGARQVGKTWALQELGKRHFQDVAYFNFDEEQGLAQFFKETKDPTQIITNLSVVHGRRIAPNETLVILDEIQECNEALNALKYFNEKAPEYAVACAGSLLGVALSGPESFPVGKVNFIDMYPLDFSEFLKGCGDEPLADYLDALDVIRPVPDLFHTRLLDRLKQYFLIGGMPEAVSTWAEYQDLSRVEARMREIINAYELDFSKHAPVKDIPKLRLIWNSIPAQLARENRKFIYGMVKQGARAREYEDALNWLIHAGLIHSVSRCTKPGLPISAYDDLQAFKIYLLDIGLLRVLSGLPAEAYGVGSGIFEEFKGAFSENFALQMIFPQFAQHPRYWTSTGSAEVDFVVQSDSGKIVPIEVKAGINVRARSLREYMNRYDAQLGIRISLQNLRRDNDILNVPLYLAHRLSKLMDL